MNDFMMMAKMARMYKEKYPAGTRLELVFMANDPRPIEAGTRGTVQYVDDMGQIHMKWDNGRTLALIPGEDSFKRVIE